MGNQDVQFSMQLFENINENKQDLQLQIILKKPKYDRALGCLFGSFIGDALGSYCQFEKKISDQVMKKVMKLDGGGTFNTKPGQFTDDSEMARHLIQALSTYKPNQPLKDQINSIIYSIAKEYVKWYCSEPFDIGNTCQNSIRQIKNNIQSYNKQKQHKTKNESQLLQQIFEKIKKISSQSQSNGSLMRITPMAFWLSLIPQNKRKQYEEQIIKSKKDIYQFVEEIELVHPNNTLVQAGYEWVQLLLKLILRQNDEQINEIYKNALNESKLKQWVKVAEKDHPMDCIIFMGWAKIAWTYGFQELKQIIDEKKQLNNKIYLQTMKKIIQRAGDTDTNAAIIGGMIGSIIGFKQLPAQYLKKIMQLRFKKNKQCKMQRPNLYEPRNFLCIALKMINKFTK